MITDIKNKTGVEKEKIQLRLKKMVSEEKIKISKNYVTLLNKKMSNTDEDYEVLKKGPITIERRGNIITAQSHWEKGEHEQFLKSVKANMPNLRDNLNKKLEEIENTIVQDYNPLDVLASVAFNNTIVDPESYSESSFHGKPLIAETIQNIILKHNVEKYEKNDKNKNFEKIEKMLEEYFLLLTKCVMFEGTTRENFSATEKQVYFYVLQNFLLIRGHAYPQHYEGISEGLFSSIEETLKTKGFTIQDYWTTVHEIQNQINNKLNKPREMILEEHKNYRSFVEKNRTSEKTSEELLNDYFKEASSRLEEINAEKQKILSSPNEIFRIQINDKINQKLIDFLSMDFGDNKGWKSPLDKSNIAIKPIITLNEQYYCCLWGYLVRHVIQIIESILTKDDKQKVNYSKIKGNFLEEKAMEFLSTLLVGETYNNLRYPKDNEIDGIIIVNDLVFLIEVKGKKRRVIAGKNDILELSKEDFNAHINEAFEQSKKAYDYIDSTEEAQFRDSKGELVLKLKKSEIRRMYLINVTLDDFSDLVLNLNLVKSWDSSLISGKKFPWIVSIYDLWVISDLLKGQTGAFIRYLTKRIEIEKNEQLTSPAELDFLGYFLENGDLVKGKEFKSNGSLLIHGYSEKIDRWYSFLRGEVHKAEKPCLKAIK